MLLQFAQGTSSSTNLPAYHAVSTTTNVGLIIGCLVFVLAIVLFLGIIPMWKVYQKAGRRGWASIVPIYSTWVLFDIVGFPAWVSLLQLVPFVNIIVVVMALVAYIKLAQLFGRSVLFGIGIILLPFIFLPILGYGKSRFIGTGGVAPSTPLQSSPEAGAPAGAFNPAQPSQSAVDPAVNPTIASPEPPTAPADPVPQPSTESQPAPNPSDEQSPPPPTAPAA